MKLNLMSRFYTKFLQINCVYAHIIFMLKQILLVHGSRLYFSNGSRRTQRTLQSFPLVLYCIFYSDIVSITV